MHCGAPVPPSVPVRAEKDNPPKPCEEESALSSAYTPGSLSDTLSPATESTATASDDTAEAFFAPFADPLSPAAEKVSFYDERLHAEAAPPPVPKTPPVSKPRRKRRVLPLLLCLLAIVGGGVTGFGLWHISPTRQLHRALAAQSYAEAISLCDSYKLAADSLTDALTAELEGLLDAYLADALSHADALDGINALEALAYAPLADPLSAAKAKLDALELSRTAFRTAETLLSEREYLRAVAKYKEVIAADPYYETAQRRWSEAIDAYRADALARAQTLADKDAFGRAIAILEDALTDLPGDTELSLQITVYEKAAKDKETRDILSVAEDYADSGNHADAVRSLQDELAREPDNATLAAALAQFGDRYATAVISNADTFVKAGSYEEALALLDTALDLLPNNAALTKKRAAVSGQQAAGSP